MNLMKLLTVGQSLKKGPVLGKYKLQQILLPKFGSTVLPSKPALVDEAHAPSSEPAAPFPQSGNFIPSADSTSFCAVETETQKESVARAMDETQKIPPGTILRRIEETAAAPCEPAFMINLMSRFTAFSQRQISSLKKKCFSIRSKKKSGLTPVQTEWSLEKVTVIRNDLSEADLEIVAPKVPAKIETQKPGLPDLNRVKNSGMEWIKRTSRLFKTSSPFAANAMEKHTETDRAGFASRS